MRRCFVCLLLLGIPISFCTAEDRNPDAQQNVDAPAPREARVTIAKDTTRITEPLTENGRVDYFEALDQYMRAGVSVENNAGVPLIQVLGPQIVIESGREDFFTRVGLPQLPEEGEYFVTFSQFLRNDDESERPRRFLKQPWTRTDDPTVYGWIKSNEEVLNRICDATRREKFYWPLVLPPIYSVKQGEAIRVLSEGTVGFVQLQDVSVALGARAMLRLGEGDVQAARRDLMAVHRLARLLAQPPLMFPRLVGDAIEKIACSGEIAIAHSNQLSAAEALEARAEIEQLIAMPDMATAYDVGERYSHLDIMQTLANDGLEGFGSVYPGRSPFQNLWAFIPNSTINYDAALRHGNRIFDRISAGMRETNPNKRREILDEISKEYLRTFELANDRALALSLLKGRVGTHLGELVSGVIHILLAPGFGPADRADLESTVWRNLTRLSLALAAYRADHRAYPESLAQLVPNYINELPQDAFSAAPFHYSINDDGYLLYSVGENGADDNGRNAGSQPNEDDIVVRVSDER